MATAKRYPFTPPRAAGPSGELWTASLSDGRTAVVLYGRGRSAPPDIAATAAPRLARAGFTAVTLALSPAAERRAAADLAAVCDALGRGDLVPGLRPPASLVVLGFEDGVEAARAYAARRGVEYLVTLMLVAGGAGAETTIEAEMFASGSHVVERFPQLGEALDGILAWLARVM